ncbi:MAG: beta-ketoacyl synthase N-terminal-like domain-containing protein [Verrucomicrobiota bacterium]
MSVHIAGMGWVTPLGSDLDGVWQRLLRGESATAETISGPLHNRAYTVFRVPADAIAGAPKHPRLRRSSAISKFAVVAGLAALEHAQLQMAEATAQRTALIFAISNGGVIYTKKFYHEIVEAGAQAASPLLFPETVFNAPASHLAAILGITGASYTLVGDGAVGILALKMAEDLLQNELLDQCLVVGAEEADWLLCDAYRRWRLLRPSPPLEPFGQPPRGMILSEGAGAVLLQSEGRASARPGAPVRINRIAAGSNYPRQSSAATCVAEVFAELSDGGNDLVVASANGTFIDQAELTATARHSPSAFIYPIKGALGESVGASGLWQTICGALALRTQSIPGASSSHFRRVLVSTCGLNQQVSGLRLAFE